MTEELKNVIARKAAAQATLEELISRNAEEIDEYVIEYLDDLRTGRELLEELDRLKKVRDALFTVRDALEEDIERIEGIVQSREQQGI